jgi:hypothetical protein
MVLLVTDKCNMCCAHCMQQRLCRPDMSWEVFEKAVDKFGYRVKKRGEPVRIFSAEPTMHPDLFRMLDKLIEEGLFTSLSTNGKITESALRLCEMAKAGLIEVSLSLDRYHEKIDPEVIKAFRQGLTYAKFTDCGDGTCRVWGQCRNVENPSDKRLIGVCHVPVAIGRAKNLSEAVPPNPPTNCPSQLTISSVGNVTVCGGEFGCKSAECCYPLYPELTFPFGNLDDPDEKFDPVFNSPWRRLQ